jgi:hypothetical protein
VHFVTGKQSALSNRHSDRATAIGNWQLAKDLLANYHETRESFFQFLIRAYSWNSRLPSLDLRQSVEVRDDVVLLTADCSQLSVTLSACELLSNE